MNLDNLKIKLEDNGINKINGKTEQGTYSITERDSLWSGSNRLNSSWSRAELIIIKDEARPTRTDHECIDRWKTNKNTKQDQMILLNSGGGTWCLYDKEGKLIGDESFFIKKYEKSDESIPLQVIYFGAPGTGKSHTINEMIKKQMVGKLPDLASKTPAERVDIFDSYLRSHGYKVNDNGKLVNGYPRVLTKAEDAAIASKVLKRQISSISELTSLDEIQKIIDHLEGDDGKEYNAKRSNGTPSAALKQYKNLLSKNFTGNIFRITFHPESDYASFVGCYKPSMEDGKIVYSYTTQAFTDAYIYAWTNKDIPTYLIIEEINRGNCAAIFGDLFQLLDRKEGISEYPIRADKDLTDHLNKCLSDKGADGIKEGLLCLPKNLHIIATMNTSDQGLFPMDSAFKRRWEWKYIPIKKGNKTYTIVTSPTFQKDWWDFIRQVNKRIEAVTLSSDKKIGFWFVKPDDGIITAEYFVSKVVSYLWNDIFKNVDKRNKENIFLFTEDENTTHHTFDSFFDETTGKINISAVENFILGIMKEHTELPIDDSAKIEDE